MSIALMDHCVVVGKSLLPGSPLRKRKKREIPARMRSSDSCYKKKIFTSSRGRYMGSAIRLDHPSVWPWVRRVRRRSFLIPPSFILKKHWESR